MSASGPSSECPAVEVLAPEIALGVVSGAERATALAHIGHCASCRRLVEELSAVADPLLLLAPEAEPAIGFESRVLAQTAEAAATTPPPPVLVPRGRAARPSRRQRLGLVAAAAAATLLVGAGGLVIGRALVSEDPPVRTALAVSASGRATCRAFAYGEHEAWVFVNLEAPKEWTADYTVEITTEGGGTPATVGRFHLQDGSASFGAKVDVPASRLRAVRVLDASGALRYEAPFETAT
jgi:anti-sigma-K factor RskA